MDDKSIMKFESVLPENFNGTFTFTNWTDEDFVGIWGGKQYHYPSMSTSPMIIPDIRKKFARDMAEREFYKSEQYTSFLKQERNPDGSPRSSGIHQAATYSLDTLTPYIKKCLEDLPINVARVTVVDKQPIEDLLTRDDEGNLNTEAIDGKTSLKSKAFQK
jgi:hypothetical protein